VRQKLVAPYEPVAQSNYRKAAQRFDGIAEQFIKCANIVDVDAGSDAITRQRCYA
jgi:hypothetical protein